MNQFFLLFVENKAETTFLACGKRLINLIADQSSNGSAENHGGTSFWNEDMDGENGGRGRRSSLLDKRISSSHYAN